MAIWQEFEPEIYVESMIYVAEGWKVSLLFTDGTEEVYEGPDVNVFENPIRKVCAEEVSPSSIGRYESAVISYMNQIEVSKVWIVFGDGSHIRYDVNKKNRGYS